MKSGSIFPQMSIFLSTGTELTSVEKVGFVCGTVAWKCSVIKRCSFKFCKIDRKLPVNVSCEFWEIFRNTYFAGQARTAASLFVMARYFLLISQSDFIFIDIGWNYCYCYIYYYYYLNFGTLWHFVSQKLTRHHVHRMSFLASRNI